MHPVHRLLELGHTIGGINGQVRVHIVVVLYGVRRTCLPLYHMGIITRNAVGSVVRTVGMFDNAGKPHVGESHIGY